MSSGEFDPYHRWLGIPPKDQPPNHYRLLGLDLFEADPEVIRDAAERQMAHVRTYQLSQYVQRSQQILNELGIAKSCLLDRVKKAAYDGALSARTKPSGEASVPVTAELVDVAAIRGAGPPEIPAALDSDALVDELRRTPGSRRTSVSRWMLLWLAAGATAMLAAIGLAALFSGHGQPTEARQAKPISPVATLQPTVSAKLNVAKAPAATVARAPKLSPVADTTIEEGKSLRLQIVALDPGSSEGRLRFSLGEGAPKWTTIGATTGTFNWTPSKEQGPGQYPITVRVLADGAENLGDATSFRITVRQRPRSLALQPVLGQVVAAGATSRFTVGLREPVEPSDSVVFSLPEAPPWVSIDSTTGEVTCAPPETQGIGPCRMTVRAESDAGGLLQDEKVFSVYVNRPLRMSVEQMPQPARSAVVRGDFKISLPSGQVLTSVSLDLREVVSREIEKLKNPKTYVLFQEGSDSAIAAMFAVKAEKPNGPTVFFFPFQSIEMSRAKPSNVRPSKKGSTDSPPRRTDDTPQFKQYVNYYDGKWHGVLATWDSNGQREFWCNYKNGKRDGLCCLFNLDVPMAVLECSGDKIEAVHRIADGRVAESVTNVEEALGHNEIGPMVTKINAIEQRLKDEDAVFRDRVKAEVRRRIADLNQQRSQADGARAAERAREQQQNIQNLLKKGRGY